MDNLMLRRRLMMAAQGVWTTVTATTPFSVQNALKSKMRSLIQYGKMVQDGTPTPTAPVYPSINNGAVRMVDPDLPAGYKRLAGLTLENARFETDIILTGASTLRFSASGKAGNWIGAYHTSDADNNYSFYASTNTGGKYLRYAGETYNSSIVNDTRYDITITPTGVTGNRTPSTWTQKAFVSTYPVSIGATTPGANPAPNVTFYGSIFADDTEIIPCERESDGALGYFVNGAFLTDTAGGTVTSLGYDNSHLVPGLVGTPEVLAVGHDLVVGATYGGFIRAGNPTAEKPRGSVQLVSGWCHTGFIPVQPETAYRTVTQAYEPATGAGLCYYEDDTEESCLGGVPCQRQGGEVFEFETPENCHYVRFSWKSKDTNNGQMYLLSEIQTASVPDIFAVDNYRDEVDIISGSVTRRVKRYVFDGTENWTQPSGADYFRLDGMFTDAISYSSDNPAIVCTHFVGRQSKVAASNMADGEIKLGYTSTYNRLYLKYAAMADAAALKAFFAEQYAAGTPVIMWYPLAEPYTESTIPQELSTVKGVTVIHAATPVAPVSITMTYRAKKAA